MDPNSIPRRSAVETGRQTGCHRLESIAVRRTHCAAAGVRRPTTFIGPPVAKVAILPTARKSVTGVPRLKEETPLRLVE